MYIIAENHHIKPYGVFDALSSLFQHVPPKEAHARFTDIMRLSPNGFGDSFLETVTLNRDAARCSQCRKSPAKRFFFDLLRKPVQQVPAGCAGRLDAVFSKGRERERTFSTS
jgi:hypothetical protein